MKIQSIDGDLTVGSVYCSPAASRSQSNSFFSKVLSLPGPSIICGDFNAKHTAWNNPSSNLKGTDLFKLCNYKHFSIHAPDCPTLIPARGEPSTVNFVLSKLTPGISNPKVLNELSSDHLPIEFAISFNGSAFKDISIFNFKKANWNIFRSELSRSAENLKTLTPALISSQEIDDSINKFVSCVHAAEYPYSVKLHALTKARNRYRNLYLSSGDPFLKSA